MTFYHMSEDEIIEVPSLFREGNRQRQNWIQFSLIDLDDPFKELHCGLCTKSIYPSCYSGSISLLFCGLGGFRVNEFGKCDEYERDESEINKREGRKNPTKIFPGRK